MVAPVTPYGRSRKDAKAAPDLWCGLCNGQSGRHREAGDLRSLPALGLHRAGMICGVTSPGCMQGSSASGVCFYAFPAPSQGLITASPIASKGLVSRVAMGKPLAATLAPIMPS